MAIISLDFVPPSDCSMETPSSRSTRLVQSLIIYRPTGGDVHSMSRGGILLWGSEWPPSSNYGVDIDTQYIYIYIYYLVDHLHAAIIAGPTYLAPNSNFLEKKWCLPFQYHGFTVGKSGEEWNQYHVWNKICVKHIQSLYFADQPSTPVFWRDLNAIRRARCVAFAPCRYHLMVRWDEHCESFRWRI